MNKVEELKNFQREFVYIPDGKVDSWRILTGPYKGDCDDFACTLLYRLSGKNIFSFWLSLVVYRATFWFCKAPSGSGHLILQYEGEFADNTVNHWYSYEESPHTKMFPLPYLFVALKMLLGKFFR